MRFAFTTGGSSVTGFAAAAAFSASAFSWLICAVVFTEGDCTTGRILGEQAAKKSTDKNSIALLPLNSSGRFRTDVVHNPVDSFNIIDDFI